MLFEPVVADFLRQSIWTDSRDVEMQRSRIPRHESYTELLVDSPTFAGPQQGTIR